MIRNRVRLPGTLALSIVLLALYTSAPPRALAAGKHMSLVGTLAPWERGEYSNVAADATRGVAYLGSFDDQGVAVIDIRDREHPVLTDHLDTHINHDHVLSGASPDGVNGGVEAAHEEETSDSADLDLVGRYLAVSHQDVSITGTGFEGISLYDTASDPWHPTLLRRIEIPGGVHTVQIDPEVEHGRPYAYANSVFNRKMTIVNIETGAILSQYASSKGIGCLPSDDFCVDVSFAHEGFIQRHPRSGRVLDYVSYWDSGLRIVDVTDPRAPVEVGAFDYGYFTNGLQNAHYAAPTPSGDYVYLEDELGIYFVGGVHILDTRTCDGTSYCTPVQVGKWDLPGRDIQTAAIHRFFHHPNVNGSFLPLNTRTFIYDVHNLDVRGENTLLAANYGAGIRLIDTTDKTAPTETAFYLPNANKNDACKMDCYITGRQTWGCYFGSDDLIYASDLALGFFIVDPAGNSGTARGAMALAAPREAATRSASTSLSVARAGKIYEVSFTAPKEASSEMNVYDVSGRRVASLHDATDGNTPGSRRFRWNGQAVGGRPISRGIYFIQIRTGSLVASTKILHIGD